MADAAGRYIEFCKSTFPTELDLKGWRIVVDCAHGAGYHVAPPVFHELGAEVIAIGDEPNGMNINAGVGATHPEALQRAVRRAHAPISASRSTATATGWSWSIAKAASTTATSCST